MADKIGLPPRPFLYTLDQVATIIALPIEKLRDAYVYYVGLDAGPRRLDQLCARNIAPHGDRPEWRVEEHELIRWMKRRGFLSYIRKATLP